MSDETLNLFEQQAANIRRSRWLVVLFVLFFAWLGFGGDWLAYEYTRGAEPGRYRHTLPWLGIALGAIGAGLAAYAWKTGPEKVLRSANARELTTPNGLPEQQLVNVIEEMSVASGLPRPGIWVVPDLDPNAFATGRDPQTAHIAVTEGLLVALTRDELQAVIAHEMSHIKNLDVRLMTFLAALVGAIALISDGMFRVIFRGGHVAGGGRSRGKKDSNLGPLFILILVLWIVSWLLAPLVTRLLALGVSRKREYLADAMAAQFTRNPMALASALEKIESAPEATAAIKRGSAHLCIADPLGRKANLREGKLADWFGTHPPMTLRISRLKAMAFQGQKREAAGLAPNV